jgi:hypothetical protein
METQPERAFWVLEFHSTKSVITVQREFRRKFEKDPPTANSMRKRYKILWTQVVCVRGRAQAGQQMEHILNFHRERRKRFELLFTAV